jgi:hypothetical protein
LENINSTLLIIIAMVLLLALSMAIQFFRTRKAPMGRVIGIFNNVKYNEKLSQNFRYSRSVGRFKTGAWDKYRDAIGFLPEELRAELSKVFEKIAEINGRIDAARKFKSDSYMAAVEADALIAPLASCREQLQKWIYANVNNPEYLPKRRSLFRW